MKNSPPLKKLLIIIALVILIPVAIATAVKLSGSSTVAPNAGTGARASACEEIIQTIKGVNPRDLQNALRVMCSKRPDCMYSPEKQNCIGRTTPPTANCGNLNQKCCNRGDYDDKKNPRGVPVAQTCNPGLICKSGMCISTQPTPTQPPTGKCGVNSYSVGTICPPVGSNQYKNAKYTCYDGQTGVVDLGRCASSEELNSMAIKNCANHCSKPTVTPTPYPTRYPTPTVSKYPTPYPTRYPTPYPSKNPTPTPTGYPRTY